MRQALSQSNLNNKPTRTCLGYRCPLLWGVEATVFIRNVQQNCARFKQRYSVIVRRCRHRPKRVRVRLGLAVNGLGVDVLVGYAELLKVPGMLTKLKSPLNIPF
jgi:hypothetical protein